MNNLLDIYELIDISSSSEEEGEITRASTPLPRANKEYPRIIVEILNSSAEATADEEEFLDLSLDSLESECKRMKLSEPYTSFETVESGQYPQSESPEEIVMADSPESPDESLSSDIFVVETSANDKESITSSKVAEYLGKVRQEDASSYFNTPPGTPKKINFLQASPLNDLERRVQTVTTTPTIASQLRVPGSVNLLTRAALSQPAPGLACGCRRLKIGRGHGGNLRFPKSCFNW